MEYKGYDIKVIPEQIIPKRYEVDGLVFTEIQAAKNHVDSTQPKIEVGTLVGCYTNKHTLYVVKSFEGKLCSVYPVWCAGSVMLSSFAISGGQVDNFFCASTKYVKKLVINNYS